MLLLFVIETLNVCFMDFVCVVLREVPKNAFLLFLRVLYLFSEYNIDSTSMC